VQLKAISGVLKLKIFFVSQPWWSTFFRQRKGKIKAVIGKEARQKRKAEEEEMKRKERGEGKKGGKEKNKT